MRLFLIAGSLVLGMSFSPAGADTIHVPGDYPTIQGGIDAAQDFDEVVVADGIYTGPGNRDLDFVGKLIAVRSENGPENCIIACEGKDSEDHRGFYFQSGETQVASVEGFTITGGYANRGGGIRCSSSSPTIRNCTISDNTARDSGGGIYCDDSTLAITNCMIRRNTADGGGGIYCLLSTATITNCTISANTGELGDGIFNNVSTTTITNCILWGDTGMEIFDIGTLDVSYSNVQGGWPGTGNIDADPVFAFADDYHLMPGSPCIDAGTNDPPGGLPPDDLDGNPCPLSPGGTADMGAYEFNTELPSIALTPPPNFEFFAHMDGPNPDDQVLSIRNCGGEMLSWEVLADCMWLEAIPPTGQSTGEIDDVVLRVDLTGLPLGEYECAMTISDEEAVNSPHVGRAILYLSSELRVPAEYPTIQAALDFAVINGTTILVADGIYTGPGNKNLDFYGKAITLRSENGAANCIIDCENDGQGLYFHSGETSEAVVDGFTITRGYATYGGGIRCSSSSPTIKNCIIRENEAAQPGWIGSGGGMSLSNSSAHIINCTITQNTAYYAGGIETWRSTPTITNCTMSENTAARGGGVYCSEYSSCMVTNCILWGNDGWDEGPEIYIGSFSALTIDYSDVEGGQAEVDGNELFWGEGNIDADPIFAFSEDNHLMGDSPCIDAATADPPEGLPPADQDGNPRPLPTGGTPDMGAYEFNTEIPSIALSPPTTEFFAPVDGQNPDDQTLLIRNCGGGTLNWEIDSACAWVQATPETGESAGEIDEVTLRIDITGLEHGVHTCLLSIFDDQAVNARRLVDVNLYLRSTLQVPGQYGTIQAGIDAAVITDDVVLIADGTYTGPGNKDLDFEGKTITVRSENGPENCIIDCQGEGRGFYFHSQELPAAVVSGFTIINGCAEDGGAIYCEDSDPTISNCTITDNEAVYGGGIYCFLADPTIMHCTIRGNTAGQGGGMWSVSYRGILSNCDISENSSSLGGAIYSLGGGETVANCTLTGNTASIGGAFYGTDNGAPTMVNSVLWRNSASTGPEIALVREPHHGDCPRLSISYCDVEGGEAAAYLESGCTLDWLEGNIRADPLFLDPGAEDYRLSLGSPCIDAADNTAVPGDVADLDGDGDTAERTPLDLDGKPRFVDDPVTEDTGVPDPPDYPEVVDMGAYEFPGSCVTAAHCDDGDDCTIDTCGPQNVCVNEYQVQVYADICLPYDPPNAPQPDLDDILCLLDDFTDGSAVDGCTCDGFRNTTDLFPCPEDGGGEGVIALDDVLKVLDAFGGQSPCDDPCP